MTIILFPQKWTFVPKLSNPFCKPRQLQQDPDNTAILAAPNWMKAQFKLNESTGLQRKLTCFCSDRVSDIVADVEWIRRSLQDPVRQSPGWPKLPLRFKSAELKARRTRRMVAQRTETLAKSTRVLIATGLLTAINGNLERIVPAAMANSECADIRNLFAKDGCWHC